MFRAVGTGGEGGGAVFDRSINHNSKRGGRLSTPHYYLPQPMIFKPSYGTELLLYRAVSDWS